jgi:hypothetical protein
MKSRRSKSRLHTLVTIAPWVPVEPGQRVQIQALCPNSDCPLRGYIMRDPSQIAECLTHWPPKDAVIRRKRGKPVVAEFDTREIGDMLLPQLFASPGRVPTKLYCYVCGHAMILTGFTGYKLSARLGEKSPAKKKARGPRVLRRGIRVVR